MAAIVEVARDAAEDGWETKERAETDENEQWSLTGSWRPHKKPLRQKKDKKSTQGKSTQPQKAKDKKESQTKLIIEPNGHILQDGPVGVLLLFSSWPGSIDQGC